MRTENSLHRLTIDLPTDLHKLVKVNAILSDMSVRDYIINVLGGKVCGDSSFHVGSETSAKVSGKNIEKSSLKTKVSSVAKGNKSSERKPNKLTLAALKEIDQKKFKTFSSTDEAMNYLNKKFPKKLA